MIVGSREAGEHSQGDLSRGSTWCLGHVHPPAWAGHCHPSDDRMLLPIPYTGDEKKGNWTWVAGGDTALQHTQLPRPRQHRRLLVGLAQAMLCGMTPRSGASQLEGMAAAAELSRTSHNSSWSPRAPRTATSLGPRVAQGVPRPRFVCRPL